VIDVRELAKLVGKVVELEFVDGHAVRAKVVTVDLDEPQEVIYDILEVLATGPAKFAGVKAGTVAAANPSELSVFRAT
jgi:hypothetical protein